MRALLTILISTVTAFGVAAADEPRSRPSVSETPYARMQALNPLIGKWELTMEMSDDRGASWRAFPKSTVDVAYRLNDLALSEMAVRGDDAGFDVEFHIGFDQYRDVYRLMALDSIYGVPDVYEGTIVNGELVVTNLKAGTTFPLGNGVSRAFRLSLELKPDARIMLIEGSDDGGETWFPAFRNTYVAIR